MIKEIAENIDLVPCPDRYATHITFPAVPTGYSITIVDSSRPEIVDLNGNITRSESHTFGVYLTFKITDNATGDTAHTSPLLVPIYKTYVAPTKSADEIEKAHKDYQAKAYGIFVHYLCDNTASGGSVYSDGTVVNTVDDAAYAFDAEAFARSMYEFGAEYVVLTCWHADTRTLFPCMANKRWRDDRRKNRTTPKSYSDRDVIMDLLDEMDKYGIDLHLYTHPTDGHDFTAEDQHLTGADDISDEYAVWNDYINELYYELCDRYGGRIKGMWFDGCYGCTSGERNQARLRETTLAFDPAMILTMNTGFKEGELDPKPQFTHPDYRAWEVNRFVDFVRDMRFSRYQSAIVLGGVGWWTRYSQSTALTIQSAEDVFKYIVAMSSVSTHGGFLASTGFYPLRDGEDLHGDYFMNGIRNMLLKVNNNYLKPVEESVKNTKDSRAYPTTENICVKDLGWGVANESDDGRYVYLHVLNAPNTQTLYLPLTADGTRLLSDAVIMNFDGTVTPLKIEETENGYGIALPKGIEWHKVDTVIKAET